jgi:DNA-binding transcriptional LysR family regulator
VQLCVRRKAHGITLTPSGTQVLHQARQLLRQAEDLHSTAAGGGPLTGLLTVGCYFASVRRGGKARDQ